MQPIPHAPQRPFADSRLGRRIPEETARAMRWERATLPLLAVPARRVGRWRAQAWRWLSRASRRVS